MSVATAIAALEDVERILVFTGAGISTESGIPDFRGPNGLWTKVDPEDFTIQRYLASEERRIAGWQMHASGEMWGARSSIHPNKAHLAVTRLWGAGRVSGVVTQNVDGLHGVAGIPGDALAELHGNVRMSMCVGCGERSPIEAVLIRVDAGERDPRCLRCGGILKPSTVMFGELLPEEEVRQAQQFTDEATGVLVIGSTLSVYPAAEFPLEVRRRGHPMVIVNLGPTDHDRQATVKVEARAGETTEEIVDGLV